MKTGRAGGWSVVAIAASIAFAGCECHMNAGNPPPNTAPPPPVTAAPAATVTPAPAPTPARTAAPPPAPMPRLTPAQEAALDAGH